MASMWRRAMLYLGLGPDEEYDDYDAPEELAPASLPPPSRYAAPAPAPVAEPVEPQPGVGAVRTLSAAPVEPMASPVTMPRAPVVRPLPSTPNAKPHVLSPTSFNEAQELADRFKASSPVIVNLQGVDRDLSRRLIDFASGLCYGLSGQMDKVANQVYLLTPSNVEVSPEERRRLHERGLYD